MDLIISKSLAQTYSISKKIGECYEINFIDGVLLQSRENDVYKLVAASNTYVLKVYPVDKLSKSKIHLINMLVSNHYGVQYVFRNINGKVTQPLTYPEGERFAVLYQYFESIEKSRSVVDLFDYGIEIAKFHEIETKGVVEKVFSLVEHEDIVLSAALDNHTKFRMFEFIEFIAKYPIEDLNYLDVGLCHGDCHLENVVKTNDGLRLIDFDSVNVNYLIDDLISMLWAHLYGMGVNSDELESFFSGYSSIRTLPTASLNDLIYFLVRKEIFYLLTYLSRQSTIGTSFVHDRLVAGRVSKLQEIINTKEQISPLKFLTQLC